MTKFNKFKLPLFCIGIPYISNLTNDFSVSLYMYNMDHVHMK